MYPRPLRLGPRARSAEKKSLTCVEQLCPNPPMIHFTNLDYMGLSDPRNALECLEMLSRGGKEMT